MKFFGFHILFILLALKPCSQAFQWTNAIKANHEAVQINVAGADAESFFAIEQNAKEKSIKLTKYGKKDMLQVWAENINMPSGTQDQQFETLVHLDGSFLLFTSAFSSRSEQFQIFCTTLDASGKKQGDAALVHYTLCKSRDTAPAFGCCLSPDKTKILLYLDPPDARKMTDAIAFKLYDPTLEMIMEKELLLPYTADIVQAHNFMMDNEGNIYMLSGYDINRQGSNVQRPAGSHYAVFFYNYKDNRLKEYDVSLKDKLVVSLAFTMNEAADVMIAGYYASDVTLAATGTFLFAIGAGGGQVKAATFMPFSKEFIARFMRSSESTHDNTLTDFYLKKLMVQADGSMILLGEQVYKSHCLLTDDAGKQTMRFGHNYDDIIATKLEANGRQTWTTKIPKRQYAPQPSGLCSFNAFDDGQHIIITFNDNPANVQKLKSLPEGEATEWQVETPVVTAMVKLTKTGSFERSAPQDEKLTGYLLSAGMSCTNAEGWPLNGYADAKGYKFCLVR